MYFLGSIMSFTYLYLICWVPLPHSAALCHAWARGLDRRCVFLDVDTRAGRVGCIADFYLSFEHVEHFVIRVAVNRDIGLRPPVANHHLGACSTLARNQPFCFAMAALHQLHVFLIYGNYGHKTSIIEKSWTFESLLELQTRDSRH